jgi:hypothetical protein
VKIEACETADHPGWLRLREALWPGAREEHLAEMRAFVSNRALGFEETERVVFFRKRLA